MNNTTGSLATADVRDDTERQFEDCKVYGHEWDHDGNIDHCLHCGFRYAPKFAGANYPFPV